MQDSGTKFGFHAKEKLITLIKNYPEIYDRNGTLTEWNRNGMPQTSRIKVEEAWRNISEELGEPVMTCKNIWRMIRTAYLNNVRLQIAAPGAQRPYYLSKEMAFFLPFFKPRKPMLNYVNPEDELDYGGELDHGGSGETLNSLYDVSYDDEDETSMVNPGVFATPFSSANQIKDSSDDFPVGRSANNAITHPSASSDIEYHQSQNKDATEPEVKGENANSVNATGVDIHLMASRAVDSYFQSMNPSRSDINKPLDISEAPTSSTNTQAVFQSVITTIPSTRNPLKRPKTETISPSCSFGNEHQNEWTNTAVSQPDWDADLQFMKSMLPDVQKLSSQKKLKFKRKLLEVLEELLNE